MHIGQEIKELARKENITLAELAKRIGKNKQSVYEMVEKEDLNTALLRSIARALNVPMSHFFSEETAAEEKIVVGNSNIVTGDNINSTIDNRHYYSDSPDVLKAQIDLLDERIKEKDAQIKEKDAQIKEKDAQIKEKDAQIRQLLEILKTK